MYLKQLSINDGEDVYNMLQRIGPRENAFKNEVSGMTYDEYKKWLVLMDDWSKGEHLPKGYVKQWTFWLCDDNGKCCGYGKIREKLNEYTKEFGGNLGFAIDSACRGKGYGTELFKLLLKKAKSLGVTDIISTVEKYNYPSKKVHEKCGGKLYKETDLRWYFSFD